MEYAFFAVKFGWTKAQYAALTPVEKLFIRKEIETQTVEQQKILQSTIELAIANTLSGKRHRRHRDLFKKKFKAVEPPISKKEVGKVKEAIANVFKRRKAKKKQKE